jgi:hypothetical protein
LAIGHFNSLGRSVIFKLTLIKSPHFCAVIHGYNLKERLLMDSAVAKFVGVDECSYFRDTDFPKFHFHKGDFNPMLHFFGEWSKDERVSTKMSSLSMENVPSYVSSYFTRWSANIIEYVSTIGNQICLRDLTIQHLASFYGHRGGKGSSDTHFKPQVDEWIDNLARVKTFIDTKRRMPCVRTGDADERQCGQWIKNNKQREKGTNSERENLMKREIPLAFASSRVQSEMDKWKDNLARVKSFIDTKKRMPVQRAGDADERKCARWIIKSKWLHGGKNSERENLMKREIPLAFAN